MFDDFNICPYTGLRSFTEEESIYFKGRDEHIEVATKQLERNKFLMLTGASGDGKSSLVYAGIIPNARSGFLRSTYSNWQVVDFRPERSPFDNLSKALAAGLGIDNIETVKAELRHGFSALVDLYKSSKRYIDTNSNDWNNSSESERAVLNRESSNLIIIADQFEEFFTNPENYQHGAPSVESALVLNILLETAKIALEDNIPIYVVFTMRSDYIGQCAAFRGLPEYIGFSQFFVPRMNRRQLLEVINEPSVLSGNKISHRLTERLIEDITDGGDQLPMLQHALNQIWKMADSGNAEMDLIHYCMVGGMPSDDLPDTDKADFASWFEKLPKKIKECYENASLQNVLNTHANILNNHIVGYVKEHTGKTILDEDAKLIIKTAFQCLTKINEGRAVRNRMTLEEITLIHNNPEFDSKSVNLALNTYRDSSNTLLKPYIGEDDENAEIDNSTILDITHESLIRNWSELKEWAKEELEDHTIFLDFKQQVRRWLNNDRSDDYLLSIGHLTYFENWFIKKVPNKHWIARYEADDRSEEDILKYSKELLDQSHDFLRASARKHIVTRTVMKYGPKRIAAVFGLILIFVLSSFSLKTYLERRDSAIRSFLVDEGIRYGNNDDVIQNNSSVAFLEQIRIGDANPKDIINGLIGNHRKINMANMLPVQFMRQAVSAKHPSIHTFLNISDSLLNFELKKDISEIDLQFIIKETNDFMISAQIAHSLAPDLGYEQYLESNSLRGKKLLLNIINNQLNDFGPIERLNSLIEYLLNEKSLTSNEVDHILSKISPFEKGYNRTWVSEIYPKHEYYGLSNFIQGFNYNGLYQEISYLYAYNGKIKKLEQALDTLHAYNSGYIGNSYLNNLDNGAQVGHYLLVNGFDSELDEYVDLICNREKITPIDYYYQVLYRQLLGWRTLQKIGADGSVAFNRNHNAALSFISDTEKWQYYDKLKKAIETSSLSSLEKTFHKAISYKNEGLARAQILEWNNQSSNTPEINELFRRSIELYQSLPEDFLSEVIYAPSIFSVRSNYPSRKDLFLFPDIRDNASGVIGQSLARLNFTSPSFLDYIVQNQLISDLYASKFNTIDNWFTEYLATYVSSSANKITLIEPELLVRLTNGIDQKMNGTNTQLSLMYLITGNTLADLGKPAEAVKYYQKIDMADILDKLGLGYGNFTDDIMRRLAYLTRDLYSIGKLDLAYSIISELENPINRSQIYAFAAKEGVIRYGKQEFINVLIDSSYSEAKRVENTDNQPNRNLIAAALAFRNANDDIDEAFKVIKNERNKSLGIWWISRGLAFNHELYKAYHIIPFDILSDDDVSGYLYEVYHDYERNTHQGSEYWDRYETFCDASDARIIFVN